MKPRNDYITLIDFNNNSLITLLRKQQETLPWAIIMADFTNNLCGLRIEHKQVNKIENETPKIDDTASSQCPFVLRAISLNVTKSYGN